MKHWSLVALSGMVGIGVCAASPSARADFSVTLTNCNSSFGCATPTGNNIATVSVTDVAANEVKITVTPNTSEGFTLVNTGLMSFVFSLAQGIGSASITNQSSNWSVIPPPAGQEDGMGTFTYGLNWGTNGGGHGTAGPLVFDVTAAGLSAIFADFATGGPAFNAPNGYDFVADVGCVSGTFCSNFSTSTTGLAGGNTPNAAVPAPVIGAGLPGLLAAGLGLLAFARRRRLRLA